MQNCFSVDGHLQEWSEGDSLFAFYLEVAMVDIKVNMKVQTRYTIDK